ncbi:uncharacterized protein EURHEDRAFT_413089 [Aspergillus ruber CBS 135680]|uniref:Uncharacterized protein n=1 Tax=Aspergillus ruber (strain CBS 135680) TaxID=1388766 RepID=A0A017SCF1_ASPRC|nr:uncharacterized protein EURHEDRAFT_413089 [Aspergillus ruber CBS 135680]EYE94723.1 hypothetical protein EURHEDRAFT_413089 [Aspergillus ruber CBS 135680]
MFIVSLKIPNPGRPWRRYLREPGSQFHPAAIEKLVSLLPNLENMHMEMNMPRSKRVEL